MINQSLLCGGIFLDGIMITGGRPLSGSIRVQGSKNAALPVLAGTILHRGRTVIWNCPRITDVFWTVRILEELGCSVDFTGNRLEVDSTKAEGIQITENLGGRLRSSILFLGALLGRNKKAVLPYPGGCTIGKRPIDLHCQAMKQLGARIEERDGLLTAETKSLKGNKIKFPFPSVGAAENAILAGVLTEGITEITGGAKEPEVLELCRFLNEKGAKILKNADGTLKIYGVSKLKDSSFTLMPDRIVAGTSVFAAAAAGGEVFLENAPAEQMKAVVETVSNMGMKVKASGSGMLVEAPEVLKPAGMVRTAPYPGFPTDLQSPLMAASVFAKGETTVEETIFESRFQTAGQLRKMGAEILEEGKRAVISGKGYLQGAQVEAAELRGGAALVLAGLGAKGVTNVWNTEYISRGYEDICRDFRQLGAAASKARKPEIG